MSIISTPNRFMKIWWKEADGSVKTATGWYDELVPLIERVSAEGKQVFAALEESNESKLKRMQKRNERKFF